jgi:hypothetical protein
MTGLELVIVPIVELIGFVIVTTVVKRRHEQRVAAGLPVQKSAAEIARDAKEDEMMRQLLGWTWKSRDIGWFATHTICRQCNSFFDTTDAADRCRSAASGFHTYTPALHGAVGRAVARAYHVRAPALFLPGVKARWAAVIKPPKPLESEWVMLDDTDDAQADDDNDDNVFDEEQFERDAQRAVADIEVTPGEHVHCVPADNIVPPAEEPVAEESFDISPHSADLLELAVMPSGAIPVPDEQARASFSRLVSSLSPEDRLALNLPHPPDSEPQLVDDEAQLVAALPHPPANEPRVPIALPSYSASSQSVSSAL